MLAAEIMTEQGDFEAGESTVYEGRGEKHPILTEAQEFWLFSALRRRNEFVGSCNPPLEEDRRRDFIFRNFREAVANPEFQSLMVTEPPKKDQRPGFDELIPKCESLEDLILGCNQGLVYKAARKYAWSGLEFDDLVCEGNTGLLVALDKFEETKGYKFSTYATWWVRQAITRAIANQSRLIRYPVHAHEAMNKAKGINNRFIMTDGRNATEEELVTALVNEWGIPEGTANWTAAALLGGTSIVISLDRPLKYKSGDELMLGDIVASPLDEIEVMIDSNTGSEAMRLTREILSEKELRILMLRTVGAQSLEQVGEIYTVTRERVRQIEAKIKKKVLKHKELRELYNSMPSYAFFQSAEMAALQMGLLDGIRSNGIQDDDEEEVAEPATYPLSDDQIADLGEFKENMGNGSSNGHKPQKVLKLPKPQRDKKVAVSFDNVGSLKEAFERAGLTDSVLKRLGHS